MAPESRGSRPDAGEAKVVFFRRFLCFFGIFWGFFFLVCFDVLLVFFGDAVDEGYLGDFLGWISWGEEGEDFVGLEEVSSEGKKKKILRRPERKYQ
jgi:hypothetical protein